MAFSPDARTLAVAANDAGHLVEVETGRERLRLAGFEGHPIHKICFSPDGTRVATFGSQGVVVSSHSIGAVRPGSSGSRSPAPVKMQSPEDIDISACLWDARDGRRLAVLEASEPNVVATVVGADFSPDGRRFATASVDSTVLIWVVATGRELVILRVDGGVNSVAFAPDGRRVVMASGDGTARIWDAVRGRELARLEGHEGGVQGAAFSRGGAVILTYGWDRTARLWNSADGRPLCTLVHGGEQVGSAGFSPDGRVVCVSWYNLDLTRTWPVDFLAVARGASPRADACGTRALRAAGTLNRSTCDRTASRQGEGVRKTDTTIPRTRTLHSSTGRIETGPLSDLSLTSASPEP
jgi:WD40 repeat protein